MRRFHGFLALLMCLIVTCSASLAQTTKADAGTLPIGDDGKPLNTDFETGDLRDWRVLSGNAFVGQPVKGDTIHARQANLHSNHAGEYWIGTGETREDGPRGILQSKQFTVTKPWAKFLIGGGVNDEGVDLSQRIGEAAANDWVGRPCDGVGVAASQ